MKIVNFILRHLRMLTELKTQYHVDLILKFAF